VPCWLDPLASGPVERYNLPNNRTAANRHAYAGWRPPCSSPRNVQMAEGTIKKLTDKGFGFISTGGSKDLFFHSKSLQGVRFEELREGQKVSFTQGQGPKGPCAENVTPV
jgi:CspA family cold shock protein